jgi:cell division inhibitor SepF
MPSVQALCRAYVASEETAAGTAAKDGDASGRRTRHEPKGVGDMRSQSDPLSHGFDAPTQMSYRRSRWQRLLDVFLFGPREDEVDQEHAVVQTMETEPLSHLPRNSHSLRLHSVQAEKISIRRNIVNLEDSEGAAEGLKLGITQIVNLETALPEVAERVVNFLDGVCYALEGTLENVGANVYLVAPANINVELGTAERL